MSGSAYSWQIFGSRWKKDGRGRTSIPKYIKIGGIAMNTDFVGVDIGASGTRYVTSKGRIFVAPNNMVMLDPGAKCHLEPSSDEVEDALDLVVEHRVNGCIAGQWHVLYGSLAHRESGTNETPDVNKAKFEQDINILSAVMAAALGVKKNHLNPDGMGLYLAMPPAEVKGHIEDIINKFVGTWTVSFIKLGTSVTMSFGRVMAYEESFLATLDFFFEQTGKIRPEGVKYSHGNLLSLDIGASTTDLTIIQDMKYLEHTGSTVRVGGNLARQWLQDWVVQEYGFDPPTAMLEQAIAEGRMQKGNGYVDCSEAVKSAKKHMAQAIVNQVTGYFRKVGIPIQTLRAVVVSGGGSMQGMYVNEAGQEVVTSPSVSEYITEYLRAICEDVEVEQMKHSPRLANVSGLFIRASMDMLKLKQSKAKQEAGAAQTGAAGQQAGAAQQAGTVPTVTVQQAPVAGAVQQPGMQGGGYPLQ